MKQIKLAILTISDRSFRGERIDLSGPALANFAKKNKWVVSYQGIVPDEKNEIRQVLLQCSDRNDIDIIVTTGGTGIAPRDVTPEATESVIEKEIPGLAEEMRRHGCETNRHALLSRSLVGIRGHTLIVNLPGNPKAAVESLQIIAPLLPHAIELLQETSSAESNHLFSDKKGVNG